MSTVAALLVTHQSARWITATLGSVLNQTRAVDRIVVVDDGSRDDTADLARTALGSRGIVVQSLSTATDTVSRIAQNFRQGLIACADADIVVLGDHDDAWHADRVARQVASLEAHPAALMVASDGVLVDEAGAALAGTLRSAFPVPGDWTGADAASRMRMAIRHSLATGGASALRPLPFAGLEIPPGWLHDRWWSLVATAREGLWLDHSCVIDYRVSADQQVGLDSGHQRRSSWGRLAAGVRQLPRTSMRLNDLQRLRAYATARTRPELSGARLLRNLA